MTRSSLTTLLIAGTFSLAALAGCQPKSAPPAPMPLGGPVQAASAQGQPAGVSGRADIGGVPFANATVKIYRPGETTPIATATTGPDGRFVAAVGVIATGGGNVIATGGGNLIGQAGGNVIATGGGNVIATGGGNLLAGSPMKVVASKEGQTLAGVGVAGVIATGGGNVIATGGGNVIATGGGNVIATGGGNFTVQAVSKDAVLSLASTLAYFKLGDKLDKALQQASQGETINQDALDDVLSSYDKVQAAAEKALEQFGDDALAAITRALDETGLVQAPDEVQAQLDEITQSLETAFKELEQALDQVNTPTNEPSDEPSNDPNNPSSDPPPDTSGGGGNNEIKEDSKTSTGKVSVSGHFSPPYQRPATTVVQPFSIFAAGTFGTGWQAIGTQANPTVSTTIEHLVTVGQVSNSLQVYDYGNYFNEDPQATLTIRARASATTPEFFLETMFSDGTQTNDGVHKLTFTQANASQNFTFLLNELTRGAPRSKIKGFAFIPVGTVGTASTFTIEVMSYAPNTTP